MAIDAWTIVLTAICTGIGVSIGNVFFEIYLKDFLIRYNKRQKENLKKLHRLAISKLKKPWLAAVLNFFFWGLGYIYTGKRFVLGVVLILVEIFIFGTFGFRVSDIKTQFEGFGYTVLVLIISTYLAYDAYKLTYELRNIQIETKQSAAKEK